MGNFNTLLINELLQHVKSFKFILMVTISLIVVVFTIYIQTSDFNERVQTIEAEKLKASVEEKKAGTYAELEVSIILPPNPLSIFSKGYDEKAGNKIKISVEEIPEFTTISQQKNPFLAIFMNFDVVSIVKIIFSLIAIFLIADSITIEREEQTLKMIFTNRVNRFDVFLVKYLASLIVISIPLLIMFVFSALYIYFQPYIHLTAFFWLKLFLIFITSLGFISIFIFIGLWISIKASSSSQALIYGLYTWMILIFVYPQLVNYTVSKTVNTPSNYEINANIDKIYNEFGEILIEDYKKHYPHGNSYFSTEVSSRTSFVSEDNNWISLPYKQGITSKFRLEFFTLQVERMIPVLFEFQNKMIDASNNHRYNQLKQKRLSDRLNILMPGFLLDEAAKNISGTSYEVRVSGVLDKAKEYRSNFINYIRSKDGFGPKYFTQIPQNIWSNNHEDYNFVSNKYSLDNYPTLDLNDIPEYKYEEKIKLPFEMFFLLLINLALLLIVLKAFLSLNILNN